MTEHTDTPVSDLPESEPTPAADPAVPTADSSASATSRDEGPGAAAEDVAVAADATSAADGSAAVGVDQEASVAATPAAHDSAAADEEVTRDGMATARTKGSANGSAAAGAVTAAAGRLRPAAAGPSRGVEANSGAEDVAVAASADGSAGDGAVDAAGTASARAVESASAAEGGTAEGPEDRSASASDAVDASHTSDVVDAAASGMAATSGMADASDAAAASDAADASNVPTHDATPVADNTVSEFTPEFLEDAEFRSALEAMLLVVDAPAPVEQLAAALDDTTERVEGVLRELSAELSARGSGIDLRFVGDGWRFYTRSEYAPYVERVLLDGARTKLTRAALETLAVVAYRQPVTRTRVSAVRGVNVDGVMRTLLARGLIAEAGVDPETNGTTYSTTELFLERIGLASLTDLPPLAPLLPGVDLIDEINESLDTDPRYTKLKKPAEADLDLGSED